MFDGKLPYVFVHGIPNTILGMVQRLHEITLDDLTSTGPKTKRVCVIPSQVPPGGIDKRYEASIGA